MLLQLFVDNARLRCKNVFGFCVYLRRQSKTEEAALSSLSRLYILANLLGKKVVVRELWLVDFDPFCVFLCFKVRCFVFEKHRKFYLSSKNFLTSFHWNMATLDSKGKIVPVELPNQEETQLQYERVKTNRYVPTNIYITNSLSNWSVQLWCLSKVRTRPFLSRTHIDRDSGQFSSKIGRTPTRSGWLKSLHSHTTFYGLICV